MLKLCGACKQSLLILMASNLECHYCMSVSIGHGVCTSAKLGYVSPSCQSQPSSVPSSHTRTACGDCVQNHISKCKQSAGLIEHCGLQVQACSGIQCEISAGKPQFGFNDTIISQVSAARQGFKQLNIRLTMAVSVVSVWFPAACNPWLRWWPLSKLAHLSASLLVLQGEACSSFFRLM